MLATNFKLQEGVRPCAVAGKFYTDNPTALQQQLGQFMQQPIPHPPTEFAKAVIVPHAGYYYSGAIAAQVYQQLLPFAAQIRRFVLLGPAHYVWVAGLGIPGVKHLSTPLGQLDVDAAAVDQIAGLPQVDVRDDAHAPEHSLEVQLPFLRQLFPSVPVLPIIVGGAAPEMVEEVIDRLWGDDGSVFIISSDLSHFHPYQDAVQRDQDTCQQILALNGTLVGEQACGAGAVNGLLRAAKHRRLRPQLLSRINSGDVCGDHGSVVGYAGFTFYQSPADYH